MADAEREQQRHERELVLTEYADARLAHAEDAAVAEEVRTLEILLRLKAEELSSPEPGLWTPELAAALLTEVLPRTVVQRREQVMDVIPALVRLVTHLHETGRWHPASLPASEAPGMLRALEFATLEAADDPSRRSFSTNILGHGLALGVDLEDETELAAYLHWYEELPDDERLALGETGMLPHPRRPYDRSAALRAIAATRRQEALSPWFLPDHRETARLLARSGDAPAGDAPEADAFVQRARMLREVVGEGRPVTATGALGRADSAHLLARLGIPAHVRSMWDHPEIVGPWVALRDGGWLEVSAGRVRAAPGPSPVGDVPPTEGASPAGFAQAVLSTLLLGRAARAVEDGGFRGMPDTAAALLAACREEGLVRQDPWDPQERVPAAAREEVAALRRWAEVIADLDALVATGALTLRDRRYRGSATMRRAVRALLAARG